MKVLLSGHIRKHGLEVTGIEQYRFYPMAKDSNMAFWRDTMGMPGLGK